ncbi:MAG: peptidase S41, partial [bacterium]|nr:peptidase S41 [bacterium]
IKLLDLNSLKSKSLLKEELWGLYSSQPTFSPNDEYIVFTAFRNFETDIFLYNLKSGKTVNITNSGTTEGDPRWSADGKYLFFTANRTKPDFPTGNYGTTIFRLPMQKYDTPFRSNQVDKLFSADSISKNSKSKPGTAKPPREIVSDFQDMYKRWEQVSPSKGSQGLPYVFSKIDSSSGNSIYTVLYISTHDGKGPNIWKTVFKPFSKPKT